MKSMAHKRMILKGVTSSAQFLSMSKSAQALYLHLNTESDDDGIAEAGMIMRMGNFRVGALQELCENGYVAMLIPSERVVYITHWHSMNTLKHYKNTPSLHRRTLLDKFPRLKNALFTDENGDLLSQKYVIRENNQKKSMQYNNTLADNTEAVSYEEQQYVNGFEDYDDDDEKPFK